MKRKFFALLIGTTLLASLFGCGKTSETTTNDINSEAKVTKESRTSDELGETKPVTLKIWAPENQMQKATIESMTKSFQALHPEWDITFTIEAQGEDTAKDEILKDVSAAGDVFFFANDQLNELVKAGAIARLGGSTEEMVKSSMSKEVVKTVTIDNAIYGIPFTHNTFIMYYDKSILNEEDIKTIEGIMAKETPDNVYNFCFDSAGGWKLASWYYGAGLTIYGESQTDFSAGANWNNETGIAVTNYLIDLINNPKCAYYDDVSLSELTADHRVGAWFDGSWNFNLYKDALGDDLGLAVIPTYNLDGTNHQLKGFYGSKVIGVNANAAYPDVAVAFAAYIGSEEMQMQRFNETGQVPTNLVACESADVQEDEVAKVIVEETNIASIMQPTSTEFSTRFWANIAGFATEIRSGELNKGNAQIKLDTFVSTLVD
ncbi:extracellular solute-binding protein [Candidatus Galacturonibacter soehngenii]|uniref:Extracellular solute-binding protein n=1 Tax=Candidatus Galacturonatibacter soehngenii TaxID=2307010 RepID=A0A7V7QJR2_9FIRM|nr:extracellular solute-binding protein [Candidatus Galacturonibacter soehngenii]KAB1437897.1 extracellular solute-binding protein [Candidatus Galacturonibacter soehngenii]